MGSKKKAKKRKQADFENKNLLKTKKLKPNELKNDQIECNVSQEKSPTATDTFKHHKRKNKTQVEILKKSNGKNNKLLESATENSNDSPGTKKKKKKRKHHNVEINSVDMSINCLEINHEIENSIPVSVTENKKLKKKKKDRNEEAISLFKENITNALPNSTEFTPQRSIKKKSKKKSLDHDLNVNQDATLHNGVSSNHVVIISKNDSDFNSENLAFKKHKKKKKKHKILHPSSISSDTTITTIIAASNGVVQPLNEDGQPSFPSASQIKLKKHKNKRKKEQKRLRQASSIISESTIIDITDDVVAERPLNEDESSSQRMKHKTKKKKEQSYISTDTSIANIYTPPTPNGVVRSLGEDGKPSSPYSSQITLKKHKKKRMKGHKSLSQSSSITSDLTITDITNDDVVAARNGDEPSSSQLVKHKTKKKKERKILNQSSISSDTSITTIIAASNGVVPLRPMDEDGQPSFPSASQIKVKKHKKKRKEEHKSLRQASSATSESTIIDITDDDVVAMHENEPSSSQHVKHKKKKKQKHSQEKITNNIDNVKHEYNISVPSSSLISYASPAAINKKETQRKNKQLKMEEIAIEYPMTNDDVRRKKNGKLMIKQNGQSKSETSTADNVDMESLSNVSNKKKRKKKDKLKHVKSTEDIKQNKFKIATVTHHVPSQQIKSESIIRVDYDRVFSDSNNNVAGKSSEVIPNDKPSSSRDAPGSPTENEQETYGSAFAKLFNTTLSQPDTAKDQAKNDDDTTTAVNYKSPSFDFYSSKVNFNKFKKYISPFLRTDFGEKVDVSYHNTERSAQNQIFCRNIISYNRDVNNMSIAYKKLDTPVYRYCSNAPGDIFISDFEISDEEEQESSIDASFISFIKPPNDNVTLYHPPADFHP